jgi:hypothetical protein
MPEGIRVLHIFHGMRNVKKILDETE